MKKIIFLLSSLFVISIQIQAQTLLINDFEESSYGAYVAWNGSCEIIVNPHRNSSNNSSQVLKVISEGYAPLGFPLSLPKDKTLWNYRGIRFQAVILEEIAGNSIHWIGFNVGVSENQNTMKLIDPDTGNGAAWADAEIGKWYTVDLYFDEQKLAEELDQFSSDKVNIIIKLGREKFVYAVDNIELIEKKEYIGNLEENYYGVNLSGAEFGGIYPGIEGTHYGYPTYKDLDYFNKKNLKLIRFPFRWERIQPIMNGELETSSLTKMKNFVKAAEDRGMPVIIDMHNFARYSFDGGETHTLIGTSAALTKEHLADVWIKLAKEFKGYSNIWGYDIMNEPYGMDSSLPWFDIAQTVIDAIRTVDTETPIIISGDGFSSAKFWEYYSDNLRNLADPSDKLIFQAHVYFDKDTSGAYKNSYDEEEASPQTGVERVKPFVEWLKRYNKRGLLGEYGIPDDDDRWLVTLENMLKYIKTNGVSGTYWSAGPRWGSYPLAVQPTNNYQTDRPQMAVLEKYTSTQTTKITQVKENKDLLIYTTDGKVYISSRENKNTSIYNTMGMVVKKIALIAGENTLIQLPAGIYIIENKKVVVDR